jgi:hypothetical protein
MTENHPTGKSTKTCPVPYADIPAPQIVGSTRAPDAWGEVVWS